MRSQETSPLPQPEDFAEYRKRVHQLDTEAISLKKECILAKFRVLFCEETSQAETYATVRNPAEQSKQGVISTEVENFLDFILRSKNLYGCLEFIRLVEKFAQAEIKDFETELLWETQRAMIHASIGKLIHSPLWNSFIIWADQYGYTDTVQQFADSYQLRKVHQDKVLYQEIQRKIQTTCKVADNDIDTKNPQPDILEQVPTTPEKLHSVVLFAIKYKNVAALQHLLSIHAEGNLFEKTVTVNTIVLVKNISKILAALELFAPEHITDILSNFRVNGEVKWSNSERKKRDLFITLICAYLRKDLKVFFQITSGYEELDVCKNYQLFMSKDLLQEVNEEDPQKQSELVYRFEKHVALFETLKKEMYISAVNQIYSPLPNLDFLEPSLQHFLSLGTLKEIVGIAQLIDENISTFEEESTHEAEREITPLLSERMILLCAEIGEIANNYNLLQRVMNECIRVLSETDKNINDYQIALKIALSKLFLSEEPHLEEKVQSFAAEVYIKITTLLRENFATKKNFHFATNNINILFDIYKIFAGKDSLQIPLADGLEPISFEEFTTHMLSYLRSSFEGTNVFHEDGKLEKNVVPSTALTYALLKYGDPTVIIEVKKIILDLAHQKFSDGNVFAATNLLDIAMI